MEMLGDMSIYAFINGWRCFIALRGRLGVIGCDQGTNFVGAHYELRKAMKEEVEQPIKNFLAANNYDFHFNFLFSSHMGGTWERHIRIVRSALTALLNQLGSRLGTSCLRIFLFEAMAIVNSRLLTAQNLNDPQGPEPLTPNNLIILKSNLVLPFCQRRCVEMTQGAATGRGILVQMEKGLPHDSSCPTEVEQSTAKYYCR